MSDYSVVHGTKVQNFASDPPAPSIGQVWYNTTTNTSKYFLNAPGSWATENTINNTRSAQAGAGTGTAALLFGGVGNVAHTETWNGTNWTEVNNLNVGRNTGAGCGASNTSALCFAGVPASHWEKTESWNGTNWTELNDLNQGAGHAPPLSACMAEKQLDRPKPKRIKGALSYCVQTSCQNP